MLIIAPGGATGDEILLRCTRFVLSICSCVVRPIDEHQHLLRFPNARIKKECLMSPLPVWAGLRHSFTHSELFQFRVFGLGSDEDGDIRVGVLPQR